MKLYEFLNEHDELFSELDLPKDLIEDSHTFNTLLKVRYGQKKVPRIFQKLDTFEVAIYLNNLYNRKWEWLVKYFIENSFEVGEVNRKTINESYNNNVEGSTDSEMDNKTSAFNVEEYVNDGSQSGTTNSTSDTTGDRERKEKYFSYHTAYRQLSDQQRNNFIEIVLNDVKNELTLKIY